MHRGYIKLYRSSTENEMYFLEPFTKWQAWQDMILLANYKNWVIQVRWNIIPIKRGDLWYSESTLATRWKWSRNKVRRFLNYLETMQQIEQHKSKVKSTITIINYNKYQSNDTTDDTTERPQTIQQTDTNKKDNNIKKVKKDKEIKNKEIKKEFVFLNEFINSENPNIAYLIKKNWIEDYLYKQQIEIEKLIKDWYNIETIQTVLLYIKQNEFRVKTILSIWKLRKKDPNWVPYIVRMISEIKNRKPKNPIWVLEEI